jgi:hypothetical protein
LSYLLFSLGIRELFNFACKVLSAYKHFQS